jgi:hypothetical protein
MKRLTVLFAFLVTAFLCAAPALAGGIEKGTVELVPSTGFSYSSYSDDNDNSLKITNVRFGGNVGYFFTEMFELQVGLLVNHTGYDPDGGGSVSYTDTGVSGLFAVNFPTDGAAVPFVGAGLGMALHGGDVDDDEDNTTIMIPTIVGGVRILVGNSASVNLGVSYEHQTNALGIEDVSGNVIMMNVGISVFVKGGRAE